MKKITFTVLSLIVLLSSCSKNDNPITAPNNKNNAGQLFLMIDRENAPSNVEVVEAFLTRSGYDTLSGFLNIQSDTTADISFQEVPAGTWHLRVNAKDNEGTILYTGESDVTVLAGVLVQVSLTLQPTGQGTGSIYIFVTWGTNSSVWTDYNLNPILISSNSSWDLEGVTQPHVLFVDGVYKMYYAGYAGGGNTFVLYAESNDGINWNRPLTNPVLSPTFGSWDALATVAGAVIKDGNGYKLYYTGFADPYNSWSIGLATSTDGINWTKHPTPILYGSSGWEFQVVVTSVVKYQDTYYLYYIGRNLPEYKIGVATSTDGINFTRFSGNPILINTLGWEEQGVAHPSVIIENNQFKMVYMNSTGTAFGFAYSPDGMNWTKDTNNPFFAKDNTANGWAAVKIAYPNFIKLQNEHRIYYSGYNTNDSFFKIGFMRKLGN